MFYKCPGCQRVWQYPIEKCPDCFLKLQRLKSQNLKVIGISKVIIPTMLHPKVPYFVLLLEDENRNKFIQKTIKEYKIGDKFGIEVNANKNAVALWRVKYDIFEAIEKTVSLIGGLQPTRHPPIRKGNGPLKINENSKILVLPTLISVSHPHSRQNTHPEVLGELIKFLIKEGVKAENIKVAGQSFTEIQIEAMAKKSQLLSICLENKVEFLDLSKRNFKRIEKEGLVFEISEEVFKNDLIINLPILKLDSKLGVKGALENLTKFWKKENFLGQKYLYGDEELILKLKEVLPEILTIADATTIQKSNSQAVFLDLVLASFNPLNLDRVFAEISMINLPEYLKSIKIEEIPISGREIGELQHQLEFL